MHEVPFSSHLWYNRINRKSENIVTWSATYQGKLINFSMDVFFCFDTEYYLGKGSKYLFHDVGGRKIVPARI